jgi:hypothetical protein
VIPCGVTAEDFVAENESKTPTPEGREDDDYVRGGKGRRDVVGGSGIYPASAPDAPADAEVRVPGEFGHRTDLPATGEREEDETE